MMAKKLTLYAVVDAAHMVGKNTKEATTKGLEGKMEEMSAQLKVAPFVGNQELVTPHECSSALTFPSLPLSLRRWLWVCRKHTENFERHRG